MPRAIPICRWLAACLLSVPACAQTPLGELFASDPTAPAAAQPAGSGMTVTAGSQLSAGVAPATLKFYRGGEVRICPRSKISVNGDARGLMLGMDAGTMEVELRVDEISTSTVFTPDLSIRLAPSGMYHFALGVTSQGNTCFKPLPGNAAGVVLSDLVGSEEYGIAADQAAFFPGGNVSARTALTTECGCPPAPPVLRTESTPSAAPAVENLDRSAKRGIVQTEPPPAVPEEGSHPAHRSVEAPFVFSADAPPAPAKVEFSALPNVFLTQEDIDPIVLPIKEAAPTVAQNATPSPGPAADSADKKEKKGFLGKLKSLFTGLFHR